jgi:molybdenum cofactor guanylyltransferase
LIKIRNKPMMHKNISGVILAGGAGTRFNGITKAKIAINGKTIISRIVEAIDDIFSEIIIVTNNPEDFREFGRYKIVGDEFLKKGPLGGIHAGLKAASKEAIFVFAGDMPFLEKKLILSQIDFYQGKDFEIIIPKVENTIEPLHAIYNNSVFGPLEKYLKDSSNKAVREFLKNRLVGYFPLDDSERTRKAFTNINSPADITAFNESFRKS